MLLKFIVRNFIVFKDYSDEYKQSDCIKARNHTLLDFLSFYIFRETGTCIYVAEPQR